MSEQEPQEPTQPTEDAVGVLVANFKVMSPHSPADEADFDQMQDLLTQAAKDIAAAIGDALASLGQSVQYGVVRVQIESMEGMSGESDA